MSVLFWHKADIRIYTYVLAAYKISANIFHGWSSGMGLGIMSLHTAELKLETNRLKTLEVQGFPIVRHWHVVHRKNKRLSGATQAFREFLLKEAPAIMTKRKT